MQPKTPAFFRIASLAAGVLFVFLALASHPQGTALKIGTAMGAALLTWGVTVLTEAYKNRTSILMKHYDGLKESLTKVDASLYDLRDISKAVNGGLAMRWSGQSLEAWDANAIEAINKISTTMDELGKILWQQRAFLEGSDQLEKDLVEVSFCLKALIKCHLDWQHHNGDPFQVWRDATRKVEVLVPDLDQRLRYARQKILADSLSV